ncbi:MAG TPA: lysophospholipid acyltransferase family protein [Candidatus Dormibacteraeota bacterium]|nr:lysophospholipid acyltransferase family protein [Candidatus Dormibacteraeota bacterium]
MIGEWLAGLIAAFARGLTGATVQWVDCRPAARQRVYFANHTSHLDFAVLWSVLPRELRSLVRPVAAKDYWSSGFRKELAVNVFHAVLIERRARQTKDKSAEHDSAQQPAAERSPVEHSLIEHAMDDLLQALGEKNSLIIFPEGTRGTGEVIAPFKSGIYHLWRHRPDVEFVPVYLANLNRVLPKGEFLPIPIISRVIFGPPLQLEAHESKESFIRKAHQAICTLRDL